MKIFLLKPISVLCTALIKGSIGFKPPPAVTLDPAGPVPSPAEHFCPTCAANLSFQNCDILAQTSQQLSWSGVEGRMRLNFLRHVSFSMTSSYALDGTHEDRLGTSVTIFLDALASLDLKLSISE